MLRKSFYIALCITLMTTVSSHAITAMDVTIPSNKETSAQDPSRKAEVVHASAMTVVNIILAGIDDKYVYAEDGRTFPISSTTRVIKNLGESRIRIAELVFLGGSLISVHVK